VLRYESVKGKPFPSLIDVTLEDLATGLESGQFTSVDLVNVRAQPDDEFIKVLCLSCTVGIHRADPGGQLHSQCGA